MSARTGLFWVAIWAASCQLGPGIPCSDDVACSSWGRCGAQGFCIAIEEHEAASLIPEVLDAGDAGEVEDAGQIDDADAGLPDAGAPRWVVTSETSLTFGDGGLVPCDTQAPAKTFTLRNDSSEALTLTFAWSRSPAAYQVNLPGKVESGANVQIKVTPLRVPKTADTSPDFFAETLTLRALGPTIDETHEIALHLTAQGARLTMAPFAMNFSAASPSLDTKDFVIENVGNVPASINLSVNSRFSLSSTSGTLGGGQQLTRSVTFTPSTSPGVSNGTIQLSSNATLCAPLPRDLVLVGNSL
jgi:hypothetical protein